MARGLGLVIPDTGFKQIRGRHQGPLYEVLISSNADSTAAWVISSAICAECDEAGCTDPPFLGSGVWNGQDGGSAEISLRSFLGFAAFCAVSSPDRTCASSIDRGRSSKTTVLASFCQRMQDAVMSRVATFESRSPENPGKKMPRKWKPSKRRKGNLCHVNAGWPVRPGTCQGPAGANRGTGNPRLVEAGAAAMRTSEIVEEREMTFRACISGISTCSLLASARAHSSLRTRHQRFDFSTSKSEIYYFSDYPRSFGLNQRPGNRDTA